MALWGKGDPRWIVEERPDAHNVNNWHWSEKDATEWSKKEIKRLMKEVVVRDENIGKCYICDVKSCEGEATINNRKQKIITFYEFKLVCKWKGTLEGCDIVYEGELEVPNLSEENDADELDVTVGFTKDQQKCDKLKELMRTKGAIKVQEALGKYMENLKKDCASTLQVPTKDTLKDSHKTKSSEMKRDFQQTVVKKSNEEQQVGTKISTKKLVMTVKFMCAVKDLYDALTTSNMISVWSRSSVKDDARVGEGFSFFSGNVTGTYTRLVENKSVAMRWRQKSWPAAHHSNATIFLKQTESGVEMKLEQTGVPQQSVEATKQGWHNYYWNPMKACFGFGNDISGVF